MALNSYSAFVLLYSPHIFTIVLLIPINIHWNYFTYFQHVIKPHCKCLRITIYEFNYWSTPDCVSRHTISCSRHSAFKWNFISALKSVLSLISFHSSKYLFPHLYQRFYRSGYRSDIKSIPIFSLDHHDLDHFTLILISRLRSLERSL